VKKITQKELCDKEFLIKLQQALEYRVNHHENWATEHIKLGIEEIEVLSKMVSKVSWLLFTLRNQVLNGKQWGKSG
jgi:hypothetical protein